MNGFQTFWNGLDWSVLTGILLRLIPALLCITLHELSHGLVAYRLGDPTAKRAGRLTLNPIRHIDPMGFFMMVAFGFGWAKPVPVNMRYFKNPRAGMALTAAAGPLSNLLLTILLLFVYGFVYLPLMRAGTELAKLVLETVRSAASLSMALAVFNILPISPLDGSKVAFSFLSDEHYARLMRYERYGMILLLLLSVTGALGGPLSTAVRWCLDRLFVFAEWGFDLGRQLF